MKIQNFCSSIDLLHKFCILIFLPSHEAERHFSAVLLDKKLLRLEGKEASFISVYAFKAQNYPEKSICNSRGLSGNPFSVQDARMTPSYMFLEHSKMGWPIRSGYLDAGQRGSRRFGADMYTGFPYCFFFVRVFICLFVKYIFLFFFVLLFFSKILKRCPYV